MWQDIITYNEFEEEPTEYFCVLYVLLVLKGKRKETAKDAIFASARSDPWADTTTQTSTILAHSILAQMFHALSI